MRAEDRNARQVQQAFTDGATLAELERHIAFLRSLGAPDDAHPQIGVNDDYEVTVTKSGGSKVEIHLDSSFAALQGSGGIGGRPSGGPGA